MIRNRARWLAALAILGLVYLVYVWDRLVVAVELVEVRKAFDLSLSSAGLIATVFTLGITVGAIPAGIITARLGSRQTLALGALAFSLCTGWSAVSSNFTSMLFSRVFGGVGEALFNVALFSFLAGNTSRFRGAAAGFPATIFGLGVFSGPIIISALLGATERWQGPFLVLAAIGLMGAAAIWLIVPDVEASVTAGPRAPVTLARVANVLKPSIVLLLFTVAVNGVAIYSFIALFQTFLRGDGHLELQTAGFVVSLFGIGQLCGGLPMGYVADLLGRRAYLIIAAAVTGLAGYGVFSDATPVVYAALAFVFGLGTNSIYTNCIAMSQEHVAESDVPLVTGILAAVYFFTAAFSGWLLAELKEALGWHTAGVALYTVPFVLLSVCMWILQPKPQRRPSQV